MADENTKTCFVIAPIGEPDTEIRRRSDQILQYIIRPAVESLGYTAVRADEIDEPGIITSQVIQHVSEAPLVVADLTGHNPNVFYELAIRHAIRKPYVQIIQKGESIPFDVAAARTIFVDHRDLDMVDAAKNQIIEQTRNLESNSSSPESPISVAVDLQSLRQSEDPEQRSLADVLSTLSEIQGRLTNVGDVSSKFDAVLSVIQEQSFLRSRQEHLIPLQQILHIAHGSDSSFGFVILLSSIRDVAPWLYDIGVEAQRAAVAGEPTKAREIFQELIRLLEISSSVLPRSTVTMAIADDLNSLFERMVHHYGGRSIRQPDRPTREYGGYREPSDADDLPW